MARPVTMQELTDWVKKNEKRTWSHDYIGKETRKSMEMKYIYFSLDTRDMKVFHIKLNGWTKVDYVDFREEYDGSILDLLEEKLNKAIEVSK